jgi:hypothetical protein
MNLIKSVKLGWKAMEDILNGMINGINQRTIINGAGLSKQETSSGTMLWITKLGADNGQDQTGTDTTPTSGGPTEGGWVTIDVMDGNCNRSTIQVWAKPS